MAAIKQKKLVGVSVVQRVYDAAAQIFAGPGGAKSFALDAQERDFVERIDHPQACVEFQAIDDADRIAKRDMFRAQVAVPFDDAACSHPPGEKRAALDKKRRCRVSIARTVPAGRRKRGSSRICQL